ncbi:MAG: efflux RND transporter permease subunit [Planctomycetaceae bacterium]
MTWLISTSLRFRVLVVALAIALIVVGVRTADKIPLDVFPEFAPPIVEIQTEASVSRPKKSRVSSPCRSKIRSTASPISTP